MSLLFVNTRPRERGNELTDTLQTAEVDVVELPLLSIEPMVFTQADAQMMQQLWAGDYQALVVVSPSAARMGLAHGADKIQHDFQPQYSQPQCPVIAVGEATAKVLRQAGWQVSCPDSMNNEGMLKMQAIACLHAGQKVLIWRGQGGRRLLVDNLRSRQVIVDSIAWYARRCSMALPEHYQRLCQQLAADASYRPVVLISSGEAFGHWQQVVNSASEGMPTEAKIGPTFESSNYQLNDFYYLALGERLSKLLSQMGLAYSQLETLNPPHILQKLAALK